MVGVNYLQLKYEKALKYEIFVKGEYGFAEEKIQNAKCIFDIGGHIGLFALWCRFLGSEAEIHYFEPVTEFYYKAKDILGNDKNIILNNCGIGSESGGGVMFFNEVKTMQSSKYFSFLNNVGKEINVSFVSLGEYLIYNNIKKIDVLKMDIEGMEFEVLSSRGEFEWGRVGSFVVEIHLLNDEMKSQWSQLFLKIKNVFGNVEVINSGYRNEIFLVWCHDNLISKT